MENYIKIKKEYSNYLYHKELISYVKLRRSNGAIVTGSYCCCWQLLEVVIIILKLSYSLYPSLY